HTKAELQPPQNRPQRMVPFTGPRDYEDEHMKETGITTLALMTLASFGLSAQSGTPPAVSTLNPAAIKILLPDKIDWRPAPGLTGTDLAVLVGDPAKPGFYVVMNRFRRGNFSRPHYHANDRYIM